MNALGEQHKEQIFILPSFGSGVALLSSAPAHVPQSGAIRTLAETVAARLLPCCSSIHQARSPCNCHQQHSCCAPVVQRQAQSRCRCRTSLLVVLAMPRITAFPVKPGPTWQQLGRPPLQRHIRERHTFQQRRPISATSSKATPCGGPARARRSSAAELCTP